MKQSAKRLRCLLLPGILVLGLTPLDAGTIHALAKRGADNPLATWLRNHPQEIDTRDLGGWTALHHAAFQGHRSTINLLIRAGADPNPKDHQGLTPLDLASIQHHQQIIALLLEKGAQVLNKEDIFSSISGSAPAAGFHPDLAEHIRKFYDEDSDDEFYNSSKLLEQVMQERESLQNQDPGIKIHGTTRKGGTALQKAAAEGDLTRVRSLLQSHPDWINQADSYGISPLHFAAINGHHQVTRLLLRSGAAISSTTRGGITPLYGAVSEGRAATTRLLIEHGANVNAATRDGAVPLHSASTVAVTRLLIENGADVMAKNRHGFTPLHAACNSGYSDVARLLIDTGAQVNEPNDYGWTPLMEAVYGNHPDTVQLLIEREADLNRRTESGSTALQVAIVLERSVIADILRRHGAVI